MKRCYTYRTRAGTFRIVQQPDGHWQAMYEDEGLGSYSSPQHALDDLAGGYTFWPSCGDPSQLGLPDELSDWNVGWV